MILFASGLHSGTFPALALIGFCGTFFLYFLEGRWWRLRGLYTSCSVIVNVFFGIVILKEKEHNL